MKIELIRLDSQKFELKNEKGLNFITDNRAEYDGTETSPTPVEMLLMAVANCSAIDILTILNKQKQEVIDYRMEVAGERVVEDEAKPFKKIFIKIFLNGKVDLVKAQKAAKLSFEKYCSVSKSLEPKVSISYEVIVE
jgi:putative redox protein